MGLCRVCAAGVPGECAGAKGCETQRENLIEEANLIVGSLGHSVSEFTKRNGTPVWQARCHICGREVEVSLDPANTRDSIFGEATYAACTENESAGQGSEADQNGFGSSLRGRT